MAYINGKKVLFSANVNLGDIVSASGTIDIRENGIHDVTNYASANVNVAGSSEDIGTGKYVCRVVDYDGSILKEKHLNTGDTFTMPDAPTNERLTFQEWASPVEIVDNQVTVGNSDLIFGATYTTTSGLSEFDIELNKATGLTVTLNMSGTKNWGDGTSDTKYSHTYSEYGSYMITCDGVQSGAKMTIFGQTNSKPNYFLKRARMSSQNTAFGNSDVTSSSAMFTSCRSLEYITLPTSLTYICGYCFYSCSNLKCVILPNNAVIPSGNTFENCIDLENIVLSHPSVIYDDNSSSSYTSTSLKGCNKLENITIPEVSAIAMNVFEGCSSITNFAIPKSVATINNYAFRYIYSPIKYDFSTHERVPTLAATNAFDGINTLTRIIVPDSLYDTWIAATNWSTYANYIYKASEVTE